EVPAIDGTPEASNSFSFDLTPPPTATEHAPAPPLPPVRQPTPVPDAPVAASPAPAEIGQNPAVPSAQDAIPTDVSPDAIAKAPPHFTPPQAAPDQIGFDRLIFFSERLPTVTASLKKDRMTIGRGGGVDIAIDDPAISRRHARVERLGDGRVVIYDTKSRNGILQDGVRLPVEEPVKLEAEKPLRVGAYWVMFEPRRRIPINLLAGVPTISTQEVDDLNKTVQMVKPLDDEMPYYSSPPMSLDLQASDRLTFFSEDHPIQVVKLDQEI